MLMSADDVADLGKTDKLQHTAVLILEVHNIPERVKVFEMWRHIAETKQHDTEFKQSIMGDECSLFPVILGNVYFPISTYKANGLSHLEPDSDCKVSTMSGSR